MRKRFNNKFAFDYILESIADDEDYPTTDKTDAEKLQLVLNTFNVEVNHINNKKRIPNLQERFADYLSGLPSVINIDFENYEILKIAIKWESLPNVYINNKDRETQEWKVLNNWFNFISAKLFQLCNKLKVDYSFLYWGITMNLILQSRHNTFAAFLKSLKKGYNLNSKIAQITYKSEKTINVYTFNMN